MEPCLQRSNINPSKQETLHLTSELSLCLCIFWIVLGPSSPNSFLLPFGGFFDSTVFYLHATRATLVARTHAVILTADYLNCILRDWLVPERKKQKATRVLANYRTWAIYSWNLSSSLDCAPLHTRTALFTLWLLVDSNKSHSSNNFLSNPNEQFVLLYSNLLKLYSAISKVFWSTVVPLGPFPVLRNLITSAPTLLIVPSHLVWSGGDVKHDGIQRAHTHAKVGCPQLGSPSWLT